MASSSIPLASSTPLSGAIISPRFVVLRPKVLENSFVRYKDGRAVIDEEVGVFSPLVKIEVETAKKVDGEKTFVHLRFCHSNRYMERREGSEVPVAESKQPDEDTESTLFELRNVSGDPDKYYFCHIQSGTFPQLNEAQDELVIDHWRNTDQDLMNFELVDWDSLVKLPKYVAFKGDNGRYLRLAFWLLTLWFESSDPNQEDSGHEIELLPNGYVKIKSLQNGMYWKDCLQLVGSASSDASTTDKSLLFWPVKVNATTIALRSALDNKFCARCNDGGSQENLLRAVSPTIDETTKLVVQERVVERKYYDVRYRMEDARIFNEKPFVAGSTTADNISDRESSISVTVNYTDKSSYSFSNTTSITAGVTAKIEADVLEIFKASIEFSFQVSEAFESGESRESEKSVSATGTVIVPPRSRAIVNYVGTMGTCNVPYSYMREDKSSTDGKITYNEEIDGVFTGVNAYNFSFVIEAYEPLQAS